MSAESFLAHWLEHIHYLFLLNAAEFGEKVYFRLPRL